MTYPTTPHAMPDARFAIGTQFKSHGKHPRICTVTDILRTYNSAGQLVKVRYVATHEIFGQIVSDSDVCDTTIARAIIATAGA